MRKWGRGVIGKNYQRNREILEDFLRAAGYDFSIERAHQVPYEKTKNYQKKNKTKKHLDTCLEKLTISSSRMRSQILLKRKKK